MVGRLTLRERAGQVIVASYAGTGSPHRLVNGLHLGGVVVFSENIVDAAQIRASNRALQQSAHRAGRRYPVLVGVDQEGGRVARLEAGATTFPTFMSAGAARDASLTRKAYAASGAELAAAGFSVDFAPDTDVTAGPADPVIGARSAGSSPVLVAEQAVAAMRGFVAGGVVPVLKHFPGHGSVTTDSHTGLPVQRRTMARMRDSDLLPFRKGIAAGASSVMVAHLDVRAVDPQVPSSLSSRVVTGLLRGRLGFRGVAFTDSLQMAAVTDRYGDVGAAVRALRAGEDVLLMPRDPRRARDGIVAAVRGGRLPARRLDQAAVRMVALLLHQRAMTAPRPPPAGDRASARLSAAAITVVSGPCSGRLVGSAVHATGEAPVVARFEQEARDAGLRVVPGEGRGVSTVRLVGSGGSAASGDVVVATDTPYVLGPSEARVAEVATYGETSGAMRALVSVLLGRTRAPGRLPVPVAGVRRSGC